MKFFKLLSELAGALSRSFAVLGVLLLWILFSLGPTVAIIWIIVHFVRKYW